MGLLDKFKKVVEKGRVEDDDVRRPRTKTLGGGKPVSINKAFYAQITDYFEQKIAADSVGQRMLFDMGYIIWMHPSDYAKIRQQLIAIIPAVVDQFYEIIKKNLPQYPNCIPGSPEWWIQVTPTDVIMGDDRQQLSDVVDVKPGEFIISSTYLSMRSLKSNVSQQANVSLSFCPNNSDTMKNVNINRDLLVGIEVSDDVMTIDFDFSKIGINPSSGVGKGPTNPNPFEMGTLSYTTSQGEAVYRIRDHSFIVSGSGDKRNQYNILVLPDDSLITGHLEFRYNQNEGRFEVAAYGTTRLNERLLAISTREDMHWIPVARNSKFLLGNNFGLKFKQI